MWLKHFNSKDHQRTSRSKNIGEVIKQIEISILVFPTLIQYSKDQTSKTQMWKSISNENHLEDSNVIFVSFVSNDSGRENDHADTYLYAYNSRIDKPDMIF